MASKTDCNNMKNKILSALLFIGASMMTTFGALAQSTETLSYKDVQVKRTKDGKSLQISYTVEPSRKFKSQEIIYLRSALISQDGQKKIDLDAFELIGNGRLRSINRSHALKNEVKLPPTTNLRRIKELPLTFSKTVPFERWMSTSKIEMREETYGCAECKKGEGISNLFNIELKLFGPKDYRYNYIEPAAVAFKRYEASFESKVNFEVSRHELKPNFKSNASELARLNEFVSNALNLEGADLDKINIEGYASPEGEFKSNKDLAGRRANVLAEYVKAKHPGVRRVPAFRVEGIGEDWAGLREAVAASTMEYKDEILAAIDAYPTDLPREADIKKIDGGKVYQYLLQEIYPPLRRTTFRMGYAVRPFKVDELPRIFGKKPELMSHQELFLLAQEYKKSNKENLEVYQTAVRIFEKDPISKLNLANALLEKKKDAKKALELLQTIKDDKRALFPMAIAHSMLGNEMEAEEILRKAAQLGIKEAIDAGF